MLQSNMLALPICCSLATLISPVNAVKLKEEQTLLLSQNVVFFAVIEIYKYLAAYTM